MSFYSCFSYIQKLINDKGQLVLTKPSEYSSNTKHGSETLGLTLFILKQFSQGNPVNFFNDLIKRRDGILQHYYDTKDQINSILTPLSALHFNAKCGLKSSILACVSPLGKNYLKNNGFFFCRDQWINANKKYNEGNPNNFQTSLTVETPLPPKNPWLCQLKRTEAYEFIKNYTRNSVYSSNNEEDGTLIVNRTKNSLYSLYKLQYPNGISKSSWYKFWPKNIKYPKNKSDVCSICIGLEHHQYRLNNLKNELEILNNSITNLKSNEITFNTTVKINKLETKKKN